MKKILLILMCAIFIMSSVICLTFAQEYPLKNIKMVVPYGPGGRSDIAARILSKYFPKYLGQQLVVVNVEGSSGVVGSREVLLSKPDGYTLLYHHESMLTSNATGLSDFTWSNFIPACMMIVTPSIYLTKKDASYDTFEELKYEAQQNPGKIIFGTSVGSTSHLALVMLNKSMEGALNIAAGGGGEVDRIVKVLGGHLDVTSASVPGTIPYFESNELKPLFLQSVNRSKFLPTVPSWNDIGLSHDFELILTIYAPPGTPDYVVNKIADACEKISADQEYIKDIDDNYMEIFFKDGYEAKEILTEKAKVYGDIIKELGL